MAAFELLLMRHARSDWRNNLSDIDRPLSRRGRHDAERMGIFLHNNGLIPDRVLVSPASRTWQTIKLLNKSWLLGSEQIVTSKKLYLANEEILLEDAAAHAGDGGRIMVLAHNPGVDCAVNLISSQPLALTESGKLMVTAAVACFRVERREDLRQTGKCRLLGLYRPKEI